MTLFIPLLFAYLLGSISPSYLFGKYLRGIDLREHGSGNVGATNAFRVLGKGPGIVVLFLDVLKGWAAVALFQKWWPVPDPLFQDPFLYPVLLGASVIAGHNWTVFLKFRGGKGVATGFGVFLALAPYLCVLTFAVWAIVRQLTHKVALGSLASALALPVLMFFFGKSVSLFSFSLLLTISTFYTHRSNIKEIFLSKKSHNKHSLK